MASASAPPSPISRFLKSAGTQALRAAKNEIGSRAARSLSAESLLKRYQQITGAISATSTIISTTGSIVSLIGILGGPLLIALLVLLVVVIISSLFPLFGGLGTGENPYFTLEKTVTSPNGSSSNTLLQFSNQEYADLDNHTFTYTITIQPKDDYTIQITQLVDMLFVSGEDITTHLLEPNCPLDTISPGDEYHCSYSFNFDLISNPLTDSRITNNVRVDFTATKDDQSRSSTDFYQSNVSIGNNIFTTACFDFDPAWTTTEQLTLANAISHIMATPGANELICPPGVRVRITKNVVSHAEEWWCGLMATDEVILNVNSFCSNGYLYTLSHELGHHLQHHYPWVYDYYDRQSTFREGYLPSYPGVSSRVEDIAEAIGLYLFQPNEHPQILNYQLNFPLHYGFALNVFSRGVTGI